MGNDEMGKAGAFNPGGFPIVTVKKAGSVVPRRGTISRSFLLCNTQILTKPLAYSDALIPTVTDISQPASSLGRQQN